MLERRSKTRFAVQLPVVIPADSNTPETRAITRDVSTGGVYLIADQWPIQRSTLRFRMILPVEITRGEPIRALCRGRVVRVEDLPAERVGVAVTIDSYTWG